MHLQADDFNLEATLDSGQVFGFKKHDDKVYEGVIAGRPVRLWQTQNRLYTDNGFPQERLIHFFDLDRDLSSVYRILKEENIYAACKKIMGLRLIRQDPWEALACFILSSNNNVKRIQGIWKNLSEYYCGGGSRLPAGEAGTAPTAFPTASQIASSHERILRQLGLGYRAPFLQYTAQFVSQNLKYLEWVREADYGEAKARVLALPGIGEKVADCVLLYGFQKYEAFPVDVWILRVMRKLYFRNRKVSDKKIHEFAQKKWGDKAGYVQQYLFHGARSGIL